MNIQKERETATLTTKKDVIYPETDGEPRGENTQQFAWIEKLKGGFEALFADDPDVFVAGDLFWYPVEGDANIRTAPDVMIAFGRPKGHRSSYKQWEENEVTPQIAIEILSPSNSAGEMTNKYLFYDRFGIEEYCIYDPHTGDFAAYVRSAVTKRLEPASAYLVWKSPRTGVRFYPTGSDLILHYPNGEPFQSYVEIIADRNAERQRAEQERERAERLAERLRALGVDPDVI